MWSYKLNTRANSDFVPCKHIQRKYCSRRRYRATVELLCISTSLTDLDVLLQCITPVLIVDSVSPQACVPLLCHSQILTLCGNIFTAVWIWGLKVLFFARDVAEMPWHYVDVFFYFSSLCTVGSTKCEPKCPGTWSGTVIDSSFLNKKRLVCKVRVTKCAVGQSTTVPDQEVGHS